MTVDLLLVDVDADTVEHRRLRTCQGVSSLCR
jgi:hypothetical protein